MIRFVFFAICMFLGMALFTASVVGNYRYGYVLNRMQAGSIADTLGAMLIIIALIIANGFDITALKLILVILFLWFANPVASHFLAKTEIISDEDIREKCEVVHNDHI